MQHFHAAKINQQNETKELYYQKERDLGGGFRRGMQRTALTNNKKKGCWGKIAPV